MTLKSNLFKGNTDTDEVLQNYSAYAAMGVETPDFLKPTSEKLDEYEIRALTNIGTVFFIETFVAVISVQDSVVFIKAL